MDELLKDLKADIERIAQLEFERAARKLGGNNGSDAVN
jgi:hypothetical protein